MCPGISVDSAGLPGGWWEGGDQSKLLSLPSGVGRAFVLCCPGICTEFAATTPVESNARDAAALI